MDGWEGKSVGVSESADCNDLKEWFVGRDGVDRLLILFSDSGDGSSVLGFSSNNERSLIILYERCKSAQSFIL
jgi:hypothetical protein